MEIQLYIEELSYIFSKLAGVGSLSTFLQAGAKCKFPASLPGFDGESWDAKLGVINHWRVKYLDQ